MLETEPSYSIPTVERRAPKPAGLLPRNSQAWIIGGIALIMVMIIAFSGKKEPKARKAPSEAPIVVDPSQARIEEYRARIEEQARKLAAEQAKIRPYRRQLGVAPGIPPSGTGGPYTYQSYSGGHLPYQADPVLERQTSQIETDKKQREYRSLFASNIALTHRKNAQDKTQELAATPAPGLIGQGPAFSLYGYPYPPLLAPGGLSGAPQVSATPQAAEEAKSQQEAPLASTADQGSATHVGVGDAAENRQERDANLNRSEGKMYRIFEGNFIEAVLTNRLDGSFSGPVNCMVTTNIYSHDGQRLLIPEGSRVLGEVRKVESFGQQRLAVVFHRLIMPDGYSVSLDRLPGLNQIGETGLVDKVSHHYLQVFGISVAIGAVAGLSQANTQYGINTSAADAYRQGMASSLSQSSLRILDRYLNVLPTFTIREGHRVKIYLTEDLVLPAYEKHQMPSDL
jgi:type IV secretion system protein TrbI